MSTLLTFYWATFVIGIISFGGGKAYIPLFKEYYVEYYHIITNLELLEFVAYSTALPGPISPMITGSVAILKYGWLHFFGSLIVLILPSIILFFISMRIFNKYKNVRKMQIVAKYMSPAIVGLLFFVVIVTFESALDNNSYLVYCLSAFFISSLIFYYTKIPPIVVIISSAILGVLIL